VFILEYIIFNELFYFSATFNSSLHFLEIGFLSLLPR